eukprot:403168-Pleurochrysis_carterae.AAC.1
MAVSGSAMAAVGAAAAAAAAAAAYVLLRRRMLRQLSGISAAYTATAGPPPHPRWNPGEKQPLPFQTKDFVALDPKELKSCYPLVISSYVPRPIAFVSTLSASGEGNLAPFSYSGVVAHDPPTIVVGICRGRNADGKKDTLANIDATGEFVVCIMSEWFVEAANHCCSAFERGVDEFDQSGLTRVPSTRVKVLQSSPSRAHGVLDTSLVTHRTCDCVSLLCSVPATASMVNALKTSAFSSSKHMS